MADPSTANRTTNNPSMVVIRVAAPAKTMANGDTTCHTPNNGLAMSHLPPSFSAPPVPAFTGSALLPLLAAWQSRICLLSRFNLQLRGRSKLSLKLSRAGPSQRICARAVGAALDQSPQGAARVPKSELFLRECANCKTEACRTLVEAAFQPLLTCTPGLRPAFHWPPIARSICAAS
jgi:hypothetical protein